MQTSSTSDTRAVLNDVSANSDLLNATKTFVAKNIVIKSDSLQMEVELNGRWQTMRISIHDGAATPIRLSEAQVTLNQNAHRLDIKTPEHRVTIKAADELFSLLRLLKEIPPSSSQVADVIVIPDTIPKLHFKQLGLDLVINPNLAKLLQMEPKLVAKLTASAKHITFTLLNQFEDKLFNGTISNQKIADILSKTPASPTMCIGKHDVKIKFIAQQHPLTVKASQNSEGGDKQNMVWMPATINKQLSGVVISSITQQHSLRLAQPIKSQFSGVSLIQPPQSQESNPSQQTLAYHKPLFKITLQDIRSAVKAALTHWSSLPFTNKGLEYTRSSTTTPNSVPALHGFISPVSPLMSNISPLLRTQHPVMQLAENMSSIVKAPLSLMSHSPNMQPMIALTSNALNVPPKNASVTPVSNYSTAQHSALLPIEKMLLRPFFELRKPSSTEKNVIDPNVYMTQKTASLSQYKHNDSVDLTRLVHNAFKRMVSDENISAAKVSQELQPQLAQMISISHAQPNIQKNDNFLQAIDKLLVTLLAAPKAIEGENEEIQIQRLQTLLKVLTPEFKSVQPKQLLQHLPQLNSQLLDDLIQVNNIQQNNISQNSINNKSDNDALLLINLFMPMKLPAPCKQTELTIGNYQKKAKEHMPEKTVWFIRLNFDYAEQGRLSAHTELMDKALDCQLLASTRQICQLATPHIDGLRRKLSGHGLQIGEITLIENAEQADTFFHSHAIVNIKV